MPTYEYRCKTCGQDLEVVQSFSDDPLTTCDTCGGLLRKLFGAPGIAFKGSGFYKNDSRGGSKKATPDKAPDKVSTNGGSSTSGDNGSTPKKEPAAATSSTKTDSSSSKPTSPTSSP